MLHALAGANMGPCLALGERTWRRRSRSRPCCYLAVVVASLSLPGVIVRRRRCRRRRRHRPF
mgnify:CR=1 FL=1